MDVYCLELGLKVYICRTAIITDIGSREVW